MDLVLRTAFVFFLILIVTRAVGRRDLSSMQPFDVILLVVIGDLVQQERAQAADAESPTARSVSRPCAASA
jgi:uncharacterized membrane protein YcaP (DUF421 family)